MNYPKNANAFMFLLMMFLIFLGESILVLLPNSLLNFENVWISQSIFAIFSFIFPIIIYILVKRLHIKDVIPLKALSIKNILTIVFMSFTIQPLLQLVGAITNIFYEDEISNAVYLFTSLGLSKAFFVLAIIPAITEELVFRGVILTGYKNNSFLVGVLMSSFYFGIMHFTFTQLFYAMLAGVIFSLIVKVTKSIYASILMHFIFNGTQVIMTNLIIKYMPDLEMETSKYTIFDLIYPIIYFILSLPFLLLSIFLFIKVNKENIAILKKESKIGKRPKIFTTFFYLNIIVYGCYMLIKRL